MSILQNNMYKIELQITSEKVAMTAENTQVNSLHTVTTYKGNRYNLEIHSDEKQKKSVLWVHDTRTGINQLLAWSPNQYNVTLALLNAGISPDSILGGNK